MSTGVTVYYQYLPEDLKKVSKKRQSEVGRELLKHGLISKYHIDFAVEMLVVTEQGKPMLKQGFPYFNISHCPGLVVCALADCPVGVDVEAPRSVRPHLINKVCDQWERDYVMEGPKETRFLELWTLKESSLKLTGEGIRVPMDQVSFRLKPESREGWKTPGEISGNRDGWYYQIELNEEYILSVCTEEDLGEPSLVEIIET